MSLQQSMPFEDCELAIKESILPSNKPNIPPAKRYCTDYQMLKHSNHQINTIIMLIGHICHISDYWTSPAEQSWQTLRYATTPNNHPVNFVSLLLNHSKGLSRIPPYHRK